MRILTVRQPWAWAIIYGGKDVENRVRNIAGGYRGPVAIHVATANAAFAPSEITSPTERKLGDVMAAHSDSVAEGEIWPWYRDRGSIIGVVNLVDVHHAAECVYVGSAVEDFDGYFVSQEISYCSAWAEDANVYHLVLENPRALTRPIPYRGALGLRRLDDAMTAAVLEAAE